MSEGPIAGRLFDAYAFAVGLRAACAGAGGVRAASRASGVDPATVSRACNVWPSLSHENYLRLAAWIEGLKEPA